jgi:hypothetical protein
VTIRAVVFDIGGVLEVTPDLGVAEKWERAPGQGDGEILGLDSQRLMRSSRICGPPTSAR